MIAKPGNKRAAPLWPDAYHISDILPSSEDDIILVSESDDSGLEMPGSHPPSSTAMHPPVRDAGFNLPLNSTLLDHSRALPRPQALQPCMSPIPGQSQQYNIVMGWCSREPSGRTHDVIMSSLCQNDITTSFWCNNDIIAPWCVHWDRTWVWSDMEAHVHVSLALTSYYSGIPLWQEIFSTVEILTIELVLVGLALDGEYTFTNVTLYHIWL